MKKIKFQKLKAMSEEYKMVKATLTAHFFNQTQYALLIELGSSFNK